MTDENKTPEEGQPEGAELHIGRVDKDGVTMTDLVGFCEHLQGHLNTAMEAAQNIKDAGNAPDPLGEDFDSLGRELTSLYMEAEQVVSQMAMAVRHHKGGGIEAKLKDIFGDYGREDN